MNQTISQLKASIAKIGNDPERTPFFVWFRGRSGSTYLTNLLDSHPDILCRAEDFSDIRVTPENPAPDGAKIVETDFGNFFRRLYRFREVVTDPPAEISLQHLHDVFSGEKPVGGFKLKHPAQYLVFPEIHQQLLEMKDHVKVIHLTRRNVLKQAVSIQNLDRIRNLPEAQSCNLTDKVALEPITLDIRRTINGAKFFLASEKNFADVIQSFPHVHRIDYQQLLSDAENSVREILTFLGVDPNVELESRYKKATPDSIRSAIANYDELAAAVAGTELEEFLD